MKFYQVTFTGLPNSIYNFGGVSLYPGISEFFTDENLPIPLKVVKKLKDIKVEVVERDLKPTDIEKKIEGNKAMPEKKRGVMWVGGAATRTNEFGTFKLNEPRYDFTFNQVNNLLLKAGFKEI